MKALEIRDLKKVYPNGVAALKGIDLSVEAGDFFSLLGANGAGKSTTLGIISSLVRKTSGTVEVFGHDIDQEPLKAKSLLGVVPQEFNLNIFEKVYKTLVYQAGYYGIPRAVALDRIEKYLNAVGLLEQRNSTVRELSGGMKRRLMIARALVHEPKLLLLDEPTAGVDIEIRRSMWKFLIELNRSGITIILTTHYLEEAENLCNRLAIIDRGTVIRHAPLKELLVELNLDTFVLNTMQPMPETLAIPEFPVRRIDDTTLELDVKQDQSLTEAFSLLQTKGVTIKTMRNKSNRLEELFLGLINGKDQAHE